MIRYRKILELAAEQMSIRAIDSATRHGRPKVYEVLELAKEKGLSAPLSEEQDDLWIEGFLYPHKTVEGSGYGAIDFEYVHKELGKKGVNLALLHYEYEAKCRAEGKIPYAYRSFTRHYGEFAEDDSYRKLMRKIEKVDLLIIDEFALNKLSNVQATILLELTELRYKRKSTIYCTQMDVKAWNRFLGSTTIAEAIMDCIVHNFYELMLDGAVSMRERYGIGGDLI